MSDLLSTAKKLSDKLEQVGKDDRYLGVFSIAQMHLGEYQGPMYVDELAALRAAIQAEEAGKEIPDCWRVGTSVYDSEQDARDEREHRAYQVPHGFIAEIVPLYRRPSAETKP